MPFVAGHHDATAGRRYLPDGPHVNGGPAAPQASLGHSRAVTQTGYGETSRASIACNVAAAKGFRLSTFGTCK